MQIPPNYEVNGYMNTDFMTATRILNHYIGKGKYWLVPAIDDPDEGLVFIAPLTHTYDECLEIVDAIGSDYEFSELKEVSVSIITIREEYNIQRYDLD
jgi:hypothetical protein